MTIFRTEHNKNYTIVNNTITKDSRLSWKAKGIWLYAFSRPDDWVFHMNDLINQATDGRESVASGLKELENTGYLRRSQKRQEDGKMGNADWVFYETPTVDLNKCLPETGNPHTAKAETGNQPLLNTDTIPNTEKQQNVVVKASGAVAPSPAENTAEYVVLSDCKGKQEKVYKQQLYSESVLKRKDWLEEEIEMAWGVLKEKKEPVSNWFAFITGIIENLRKINAVSRLEKKHDKKRDTSCHSNHSPQSSKPCVTINGIISENDTSVQPSVSLMEMLTERRKLRTT
jgi:hypothetical protein